MGTAIVDAASAPVSIIIVGVGDETFDEMDVLDGDAQGLVDENGRRAPRDIVQFVAFKDAKSREDLAAQVLAELGAAAGVYGGEQARSQLLERHAIPTAR